MNIELLKQERIKQNITQEEMATHLGYKDRSSYCQIESGKVKLPIEKIKSVKEILNLSDEMVGKIFLA